MERTPPPIHAARTRFPAGLEQPPQSYRFGSDALLLGAWAARCLPATPPEQDVNVIELGSGCGAALFALLLHPLTAQRRLTARGLEQQPPLVEAARRNASALALPACDFRQGDIARSGWLHSLRQERPEGWHLVLCNPPYRLTGQGRATPAGLRRAALQQDEAGLPAFCRAGARLLRHHGRFVAIFPASDMVRLLAALHEARLGLRQVLPVQTSPDAPALRLLVEARSGAAHDCRLLPPLCLHERQEGHAAWTREALTFCPWLAGAPEEPRRG